MVEHDLLQMRGEGTCLSSSLDELQSQISRVELDMDSVRTKAGVATAHGPDCSINCSCHVGIARHEAELQQIGLALDELRDYLDSVVDSVGSSDRFSSFASDLASMHSQLDAHLSLSSQSFATLQSQVAALEEVYETWTAGDAAAEEEEDETDDDNYDHKGVCFHAGEPQCEEEVPATAWRSTTRWDGVTKGLPSEDPFADLNWVKGNSFTSTMHSGLHTLDATQVDAVGKGGRPVPSLFNDTSKEATCEMPGNPQASVDFPLADFLSAVSQDKSAPEQEPEVKLRGNLGKTGTDRPDVEALDDETRREVMKILKRPSWDGKQVSRPIFQRQWQGFHGYWFKRCGSDTMAKILLTALPVLTCPVYAASLVFGLDVQGHLGRHHETHVTHSMSLTGAVTVTWPWRLIKGRQMQTCGRCAVGEQTGIRVIDHAQHPLMFPMFPQTPACIAAIRDIGPRTAELSRRI